MSPIAHAMEIIRAPRAHGENGLIVFFSGGKESLVCLDLAVREYGPDNVHAVFMYLVDGLESVEAPVHSAVKRYGVRLLKLPHWQLSHYFKNATYMPHQTAAAKMRRLRLNDIETRARRETGLQWVCFGWRANESITRRVMIKRWGAVWERGRRVLPIASWKTQEVLGYLHARGIPIPPRFGAKTEHGPSGFDLDPQTLLYLREHYPADFAKVVRTFPLVEAALAREAFFPSKKT